MFFTLDIHQHLERFVLHLVMRIEQSLVFPRGVVPVLCMLNIIFVTLKQRYGKSIYGFMQRLENSTNSIICTLYNSCLVRFVIWNHWIESLYTA